MVNLNMYYHFNSIIVTIYYNKYVYILYPEINRILSYFYIVKCGNAMLSFSLT